MPNGRSGGFVIEKEALKNLVKAFPDATVVGRIVARSMRARPANALETAQFVDECPDDRIAVEGQDHKAYIIHLSNEPEIIWLIVGSEAPIFLELRHRHEKFATEHPDWDGCIGF